MDCTHHWTVTSPCPICQETVIDRLREENARLRQRVEELERAPRCCADTIPPGCRTCRCTDAAEARLAQAMKILRWLRNEAHALLSLEREGIIELVAITNVRALEAKIAEADAALAAAQPEEPRIRAPEIVHPKPDGIFASIGQPEEKSRG